VHTFAFAHTIAYSDTCRATHCNTLQLTATQCAHCNTLQHSVLHTHLLILTHVDVCICVCYAYMHAYLQCVAVCCSVLQCVAVCCSVLQCVAVCCGVLQIHEDMHAYLYILPYVYIYERKDTEIVCVIRFVYIRATEHPLARITATHCNTLQHTATHIVKYCNTLQHTAKHCNTLQHTATHTAKQYNTL